MKNLTKLFTVLLLSIALIACSGNSGSNNEGASSNSGNSNGDSDGPVKIGLINPMTGDSAAWGEHSVEAAELVVKQFNDNGGIIDGREVELITADSKGTPEDTIKEMKEFITKDNVDAIVGNSYSTAGLAGKDLAHKEGMLYMVTGAKHPDITTEEEPTVFRVNSTQAQDGEAFVDIMSEDMDIETVAIISEQTDFGFFNLEIFEEQLPENGIEIVASEEVPISTTDLSTQITKFKSLDPDAVIVNLGSPQTAAAFLNQMNEFDFDTEKVLTGGNVDATLIELAGDNIEDSWVADIYVPSLENPENDEFVEGLADMGVDKPTKLHLQTYDGLRVVLEAMDEAGTTDTDKVAEMISSSTFASPRGDDLEFNETGQVESEEVSITIKDGEIIAR